MDSAKTKAASRSSRPARQGRCCANPWSGITRNPLFYRARWLEGCGAAVERVMRVTGPGSVGAGWRYDRAPRSALAWCGRASAGVRRWAKTALGGCHRLPGMRRIGASRGQHFQDDTESRPCAAALTLLIKLANGDGQGSRPGAETLGKPVFCTRVNAVFWYTAEEGAMCDRFEVLQRKAFAARQFDYFEEAWRRIEGPAEERTALGDTTGRNRKATSDKRQRPPPPANY